MIDREIGLPSEQEITHREFNYHGITVIEIITKWRTDDKEHYKLLWIRSPMAAMQIDDKNNPFSHADFDFSVIPAMGREVNYESMRKLEEAARRKVIIAFNDYWKLPTE